MYPGDVHILIGCQVYTLVMFTWLPGVYPEPHEEHAVSVAHRIRRGAEVGRPVEEVHLLGEVEPSEDRGPRGHHQEGRVRLRAVPAVPGLPR